MKTLQLSLFFLSSTFFYATAQEPATFLKDENVKGKVKSIISSYQGVKYQREQRKYEYLLNASGQLIKKTYYWQNKLNSITEYSYDAKGFLIEEKSIDPNGTVTGKEVYTNDIKGNVIKQNTYYEGSATPTYVKTITRNASGKVLTEVTKQLPENTIYYPKYSKKYDEKGNIIEDYTEFGSGLFSKTTYQYTFNSKGKIEKEVSNNVSTSMMGDGNDYKTTVLLYRYDDKDRIIAITDEQGNMGNQYTYDEQDNLTKEDKKEYLYEYDQKGNWTKKTTISEGQTYCIEERTYTYID